MEELKKEFEFSSNNDFLDESNEISNIISKVEKEVSIKSEIENKVEEEFVKDLEVKKSRLKLEYETSKKQILNKMNKELNSIKKEYLEKKKKIEHTIFGNKKLKLDNLLNEISQKDALVESNYKEKLDEIENSYNNSLDSLLLKENNASIIVKTRLILDNNNNSVIDLKHLRNLISKEILSISNTDEVGYSGRSKTELFNVLEVLNDKLNDDNSNNELVLSSLVGFAIGDAFGVPYELLSKSVIRKLVLNEMIGKDSNLKFKSQWSEKIPAGAWSDDTSMIYSAMSSIVESKGKIDYYKVMDSYLDWSDNGNYCSIDFPFGIENAVNKALGRYKNGVEPFKCGGVDFDNNSNGALSRILPFSLYCIECNLREDETFKLISEASSITHGHDISKMGCFIFTEFMRKLYETGDKELSFNYILDIDYSKYFSDDAIKEYSLLLNSNFRDSLDEDIKGSRYVVDTLNCAIYSVLNTDNYSDSIKMAIDAGYDTDTVAGVCGALSGVLYGYNSFPEKWSNKLLKKENLELIAIKYSIILDSIKNDYLDKLFD